MWYQLVYHPGDENRADDLWSIELLEIKHRSSSLRGTMWRTFFRDFEKRWTWQAYAKGNLITGSYRQDRGNGGDGLIQMIRVSPDQWSGDVIWAQGRADDGRVLTERQIAPMEWIRVSSCHGQALQDWNRALSRSDLIRLLPRRCRKVVAESCGFAGSTRDSLGPAGAIGTLPAPALRRSDVV
jgi:hypothetical protein